MTEKIEIISTLFLNDGPVEFDGEKYVLPESAKSKFDSHNIPYDEEDNLIKLKLKSYFNEVPIKYFESLESEVKYYDLKKSFLIVSKEGTFVFYQPNSQNLTVHGSRSIDILDRVKAIIAYFRIFNHFKSENFCDYFNDGNSEIVIYSSINGIIKVKYDIIPKIGHLTNVEKKATQLIELSTPLEIAPFFKNGIYTLSKSTGIISLSEIIEQSEDLISITKRDHELVSKQFDFEKFRDSIYKEKEKYFTSIRELVSKIFSQAVGIPISISASVFATYKVSDDAFMLFLVLLAFSLYVAFYIKIQFVYRSDLDELKKDFEEAFNIVKEKSGLSENLISSEKEKVTKKIKSTRTTINWLIVLVIALSLLVLFYMVYEISYSESLSLIKLIFG